MQYNLRMDPLKFAFGVSSSKLTVHLKGINLDTAAAKAIQDIESPTHANS